MGLFSIKKGKESGFEVERMMLDGGVDIYLYRISRRSILRGESRVGSVNLTINVNWRIRN